MSKNGLVGMSETIKLTGKSRSTINRYIKSGKLSVADKTEFGHHLFDVAELSRVFGSLGQNETGATLQQGTNDIELERLYQQLDRASLELREERQARDAERDRLLTMLENKDQAILQLSYEAPQAKESHATGPSTTELLTKKLGDNFQKMKKQIEIWRSKK